MKTVRIAIGADHRGYELKQRLQRDCSVEGMTIDWHDVGAYDTQRSDYPEFGIKVARLVQNGEVNFGILLCGTGVGMAIAANRFERIYAALAWNEDIARESREDDYANVLVLPADHISYDEACKSINAWLKATPQPGRYQNRIAMIDAI